MEKLDIQRSRLESIYRQKSRETWLLKGDHNSKFFHTSLLVIRRRNKITFIRNGAIYYTEEREIVDYFIKNFEELFKSNSPRIPLELEGLGEKVVTIEEIENLICIPNEKEVKKAIWNLHPLKSLGPDGYPGIFYRKYWNIIKEKMIKFVQECFKNIAVPRRMNQTLVVLIPKSDHPTNANHFRPISLCKFNYKIVSKIITNRMTDIMDRIVLPHQRAFVWG